MKPWFKKIGWIGFFLFLIKGLIWFAILYLPVMYASK